MQSRTTVSGHCAAHGRQLTGHYRNYLATISNCLTGQQLLGYVSCVHSSHGQQLTDRPTRWIFHFRQSTDKKNLKTISACMLAKSTSRPIVTQNVPLCLCSFNEQGNTNIRVRGGDPRRRHKTLWACDGWGSGASRRLVFVFVSAPPHPGPPRTHDPPTTNPRSAIKCS